jgi:hypothetical protein
MIQAVAEAIKATLESQERVAKMNIDAQERAVILVIDLY